MDARGTMRKASAYEATELLRAALGTETETQCIADFVAARLGWYDRMDPSTLRVKDVSGFGGSKVCLVSGEGVRTVAVKMRMQTAAS
jgi:hypothetical protein